MDQGVSSYDMLYIQDFQTTNSHALKTHLRNPEAHHSITATCLSVVVIVETREKMVVHKSYVKEYSLSCFVA